MPTFPAQLPLSLYIHIPWCVRKCPYCDFNSHEAKDSLPEELYVNALLQQLDSDLVLCGGRPLTSIFFGGGTPSLFSGVMIGKILQGVSERLAFTPNIEITLEANPGTIDQDRFHAFREAGINRLSLGIQSLQDDKLKALGRIHDRDNAIRAVEAAKAAGFTNFNLDLMFGLPQQSIDDALHDLRTAISLQPMHLSWYQLTIEPNTLFYKHTPTLPPEDAIWDMQLAGQALLADSSFKQYEVSAYSLPGRECRHNLNYWQFGDYLGIGAGAHSKLTDDILGSVTRFAQVKQPRDYLDRNKRFPQSLQTITRDDLTFEFMLNALRLNDGVPTSLYTARTGLPLSDISKKLDEAKASGLLLADDDRIAPSEEGKKFLNNLVSLFLPA